MKTKDSIIIGKMKTIFLMSVFASTIVIDVKAQMQPTNGGFENWEDIYFSENPVGWSSLNNFYGVPEMSFKTTDAHTGSYALKIISDTATLPPPFGNNTLDTIAGFVFLGSLNMDNPGIPYTDRPISFKAFLKANILFGGEAYLMASLSKWNPDNQSREEVGTAMFVINQSIPDYDQVTIPFNYINSNIPDTLDIKIMGGNMGPGGVIIPGNTLYIDDISFTFSTIGTDDIELNSGFKVYPNPTQSKLYISSEYYNELTFLKVFDVLGKELISTVINANPASVDVSVLPLGVYQYQIADDKGSLLSIGNFIRD